MDKAIKNLWWFLGILTIAAVFAAEYAIGADPAVTEPTADEWMKLVQSLNGAQGAGTLVGVGVGVQAALLLARSKFSNLSGPAQLLAVTGLTMLAGPISLIVGGMAPVAAVTHSATLTAAQVFGNQLFKKFLKKKK